MNSMINTSRYIKVFIVCAGFLLVAAGCGLNSSLDPGEPQTGSLDETASGSADLCGNGKINKGEQCDGKALAGATCKSLGEGSGQLACGPSCFYDVSSCDGPDEDAGSPASSSPYNSNTATNTALADLIRTMMGGNTGTTGTPATGTTGTTTNPFGGIFGQGQNGTTGTGTTTNPFGGIFGQGQNGTTGTGTTTNPFGGRFGQGTTGTGTTGTGTTTNPFGGRFGQGTTGTTGTGTTGTGTTTNPFAGGIFGRGTTGAPGTTGTTGTATSPFAGGIFGRGTGTQTGPAAAGTGN